jgi:hypothetical protein
MPPASTTGRLARASGVHIAFAFVAMGGWALFANHSHGLADALPPALAQGTLSAILTALLKRALEAMVARFTGWCGFVAPPLVTAGAILAALVGVHALIGTPEIARTIAVPWSVSTLYAILYTADLQRCRQAAACQEAENRRPMKMV